MQGTNVADEEEEEVKNEKNDKGKLINKEEEEVTSIEWSRYKMLFQYIIGWVPISIGCAITFCQMGVNII